jgi:hypothetical protein
MSHSVTPSSARRHIALPQLEGGSAKQNVELHLRISFS